MRPKDSTRRRRRRRGFVTLYPDVLAELERRLRATDYGRRGMAAGMAWTLTRLIAEASYQTGALEDTSIREAHRRLGGRFETLRQYMNALAKVGELRLDPGRIVVVNYAELIGDSDRESADSDGESPTDSPPDSLSVGIDSPPDSDGESLDSRSRAETGPQTFRTDKKEAPAGDASGTGRRDEPPNPVREWLDRHRHDRRSSDPESIGQVLAGVSADDEGPLDA